jgi:glycine cleavage system H protein
MIKFTKDHEWIRVENGIGTVGITDYAQGQLGDVVFVELPALGRAVEQGKEVAVVESVKAASEIYAPVSGTIIEINHALGDQPGTVNEDAAGNGWFFKIALSKPGELDGLMDEAAYKSFTEGQH